ncbi:MAG: ABC transporter permease [Eubacterium sp.]
MNDFFEGLKRAKTRTILSALVVVLMSIVVCISGFMFNGIGIYNMKNTPESSGYRQNNSTENSEVLSVSSNVNSIISTTEDSTASTQRISRDSKQNNNRFFMIIIAFAALLLGSALLIIINSENSKKRKPEFDEMMSNGISIKQIKKQLIFEVTAVALIFGIIGCSIGIAAARPVSNIIMTPQIGNDIQDFSDENMPDFDKNSDFGNGEMPNGESPDVNSGATLETPDGKNSDFSNSQEKDNKSYNNDFSQMPNKDINNKRPGNSSNMGYISATISGVLSIVLFSAASACGVVLPIKKKEA